MVLFIGTVGARGHEVTPTIADLTASDGELTLDLRLNVEACLAEVDLDGLADTDDVAAGVDYDALRATGPDDLTRRVGDELVVDTNAESRVRRLDAQVRKYAGRRDIDQARPVSERAGHLGRLSGGGRRGRERHHRQETQQPGFPTRVLHLESSVQNVV